MPEFWCEESEDGSLILYYHSKRGSLLVPVAKAVVAEVAKVQFQLDIVMDRRTLQGEDESRFTRYEAQRCLCFKNLRPQQVSLTLDIVYI